MTAFNQYEHRTLLLLKLAPFQRRPGGWRFGTKRIDEGVIERLVAKGRAGRDGERVWLISSGQGAAGRAV